MDVVDVTVQAAVAGVVRDTLARADRIDAWINNADQGVLRSPSELRDVEFAKPRQRSVGPVGQAGGAAPRHFLNTLTAMMRAEAQTADDIAAVIAGVVDSRAPDVYTRLGAQARMAGY